MKKNNNNELKVHKIVQEGIDNKFYELNDDDYFMKHVLTKLNVSRGNRKIEKKNDDRLLLVSYLKHANHQWIPTEKLIKELEIFINKRNTDLRSDFVNNVQKVLNENFIFWALKNSEGEMQELFMNAIFKGVNSKKYDIELVIDNINKIENEELKKKVILELYETKNITVYQIFEKSFPINVEDKKKIIDKNMKKSNVSILLYRDIVKELLLDKINRHNLYGYHEYIQSLTEQKFDFFADILIEEYKKTNVDKQKQNILSAIFQMADRSYWLRSEDLIKRTIDLQKQEGNILGTDFSLLMILRGFHYLKKDVARKNLDIILELSKEQNEFSELKNIMLSNKEKHYFKDLKTDLEFNVYFKREMKLMFYHMLDDQLEEKNIKTKKIKI